MHFHLSPSGKNGEANERATSVQSDDIAQSETSEVGAKSRFGSFLYIDDDIKLPFSNIDWVKHSDSILNLARNQPHGETKFRIFELISQTSPGFLSALLEGRAIEVDSRDGSVVPLDALRDLGVLSRDEIFISHDPTPKYTLPVSFIITTIVIAILFLVEDEGTGWLTMGSFLQLVGLSMFTAIVPSFLLGLAVAGVLIAYRGLRGIEEPGETVYTYLLQENGRQFVQEDLYPIVAKYIVDEGI